jgi:hypothetical protein
MLLAGFRKNKNIINIHKAADIQELTQAVLNKALKYSRRVC